MVRREWSVEVFRTSYNLLFLHLLLTTYHAPFMLDRAFFNPLKQLHASRARERRTLQEYAGQILSAAKRSIFATQRNDLKTASNELKTCIDYLKKGKGVVKKFPALESEGMWRSALEEYAEASLYASVMMKKGIGAVREISPEDAGTYIGALSDLTGELTRSCVLVATERDLPGVQRLSGLIRDVVAFLLEMDLTGSDRQKFDQAKQNLRKVEEIAFDLSLVNEKR